MSLLLLAIIISIPLYYLLKPKRERDQADDPSTNGFLRAYPIVGHLPSFLRNRDRINDWITDALAASPTNTIVFRRLGNIRGIITANPAVVEHMLKTHVDNYIKGPQFINILEDFLGQGIFNSDGELWRLQRKTASFEFNTKSLRNFVVHTVQHEITDRLLPLIAKASAIRKTIDLQDVLERFAFDNVCRVSFGVDPACLAGEKEEGNTKLAAGFAEAFRDAANFSAGRFRYAITWVWMIKRLLNFGSERRLKESIQIVHDFALRIIRSRKREIESSSSQEQLGTDDLLSRFIATGGEGSDEFLRDVVISFILAGRETTSSALTWFFWILSSRPYVESKILEEIKAVRNHRSSDSNKTECFSFDELRDMQYLQAAITESMRLYPPVPANRLTCQRDEVLPEGIQIKKDWFISYNPYAMGRMEQIWGKDCLEFKPERWLEEDTGMFKQESPFKFPAFHAGPRMCLGKEMAYVQMKSIVASVVERYVVEFAGDVSNPPQQMLSLTLRMKNGMPVRVRERATNNMVTA